MRQHGCDSLIRTFLAMVLSLAIVTPTIAEIRVQDVARLKGQRTNKLMGYGLVVGLNGTGDGGKNIHTMRALAKMHSRFHQPVFGAEELANANNVALVTVEATIPEFGDREGQALDVIISSFSAESLAGGQLLTTPLQYAGFDPNNPETQAILALAGGPIHLPDSEIATRGIIRRGAVLERDFVYDFILDGTITLVMDAAQANFPLAHAVAQALNHELVNPASEVNGQAGRGRALVAQSFARAIDARNIVVRIPEYELANPTAYISRVLQTRVLFMPQQPARVVINRTTGAITATGTVTISPTVLQLPGLGTISVGGGKGGSRPGVLGLATDPKAAEGEDFQRLLSTLSQLQLSPNQMVNAFEQMHQTGSLHAKLVFEE